MEEVNGLEKVEMDCWGETGEFSVGGIIGVCLVCGECEVDIGGKLLKVKGVELTGGWQRESGETGRAESHALLCIGK